MKNSILIAIFVVFILFETAKTFTVNCDYETYINPGIGKVYTCITTNIPLSSGNKVTAVTGKHLTNKTNSDVNFINILGNWNLSFVPQGFINFFPNIKAVNIEQSAFDTLHGDEFDENPQLEFLQIWKSNLTTISSKLFEKTPKLNIINFAYTSLERVGHDLFTSLNVSQLQWIGFPRNQCIDREVTDGNLAAIISLIFDLRLKCPFNDEENSALTATNVKTLTCSDGKSENLVCVSKNVQENSVKKDEKFESNSNEQSENFQNELRKIREEFKNANDALQSRVLWLENELLRMSTNQCDCKQRKLKIRRKKFFVTKEKLKNKN